jgi:hypothetical protein
MLLEFDDEVVVIDGKFIWETWHRRIIVKALNYQMMINLMSRLIKLKAKNYKIKLLHIYAKMLVMKRCTKKIYVYRSRAKFSDVHILNENIFKQIITNNCFLFFLINHSQILNDWYNKNKQISTKLKVQI